MIIYMLEVTPKKTKNTQKYWFTTNNNEFTVFVANCLQTYIVSDLRQTDGFLQVLLISSTNKTEILLKVVLNALKPTNQAFICLNLSLFSAWLLTSFLFLIH